jgi:predicted nucleotidyltransferase
MRPSEALPKHREAIRQLVFEAGMANPRVFGSVLYGDDEEGSDLDLLVDPAPRTSLLDMAGLQIDIEKLVGVKVDLRIPRSFIRAFAARFLTRPRRCEQVLIPNHSRLLGLNQNPQ